MDGTFRLGAIGGITIEIHYTWLLAFVLIAWTLAAGFFPDSYPGFASQTYWLLGLSAALLLFSSVLVHELAHSFVARARNIPVQSITLFIFGGVSNLRAEAETAGVEFVVAVVGPATSFVLAALFFIIGQAVPERGPLGALLSYLAFINVLLGLFNLLPGFPLDGGRVLRAAVWRATGDVRKATDIAARIGQLLAFGFIAWGVLRIFSNDLFGGLWIAFIGWFLNNAAEASRRQVAQQAFFQGVRVAQLMDATPDTVVPETTVADLVYGHFLGKGQRAVAVCSDDQLAGIVSLTDAKAVPREQWATTQVSQIMTREPLHTARPGDDAAQALKVLAENGINQVLVTEDGRLVGLLSRSDLIRYIQFREELGIGAAETVRSGPRR